MNHFHATFKITADRNCPLYDEEERLQLTEKTITCPPGKEACLILVRDMTELLFQLLRRLPEHLDTDRVFNCSGCSGLIKFQLERSPLKDEGDTGVVVQARSDSGKSRLRSALARCSLFTGVPAGRLDTLQEHFREMEVEAGGLLFRRGDQNRNIYIVIDGAAYVGEGEQSITLGPGEVCGEMSYLGPDLAVATVRAREKSLFLAMPGEAFGRLLGDIPGVQAEMARLLAARLRRSSAVRAGEVEACMTGRIAEIVPAELLQIFHMHQKTGMLTLELPGGIGKIAFREGCIINASYGQLRSQKAIFSVLAEKEGRYRFTSGLSPQDMKAAEIGDFMMLLMEGIRRVDEGLSD